MTDDEIERIAFEAMERRDYDTAMHLLAPLADRDSVYALTTIGWIYEYGHPGHLDRSLAPKYFERAIALGSTEACLEMGWLLMTENRLAEARAILEMGKGKGGTDFEDALKTLATKETELLAFEAIENKDYCKAFNLLEPQLEVGSEYTLTALGWLYQTGRGGITDKDLARSLYRRAAEIGCVDAYYRIGRLELEQGNDEVARAAFAHGATADHFPSMTKLGEMMVEGKGGAIDFDQGMSFLKLAADQGHIMARMALARIEEKSENSMLKRLLIKLKSFRILRGAIKEANRDTNSPNLYEFR